MSRRSRSGGRRREESPSTRRKGNRSRACICLECGFTEHLDMDTWSSLMAVARERKRNCPVHGEGQQKKKRRQASRT